MESERARERRERRFQTLGERVFREREKGERENAERERTRMCEAGFEYKGKS